MYFFISLMPTISRHSFTLKIPLIPARSCEQYLSCHRRHPKSPECFVGHRNHYHCHHRCRRPNLLLYQAQNEPSFLVSTLISWIPSYRGQQLLNGL